MACEFPKQLTIYQVDQQLDRLAEWGFAIELWHCNLARRFVAPASRRNGAGLVFFTALGNSPIKALEHLAEHARERSLA